jgi:Uma2 family endonuclease
MSEPEDLVMAVATAPKPKKLKTRVSFETADDLLESLGGVPANRVRMVPSPGTATERDVIRHLESPGKRRYELINGTLVEKPMGSREAFISALLLRRMGDVVDRDGLGALLGGDGPLRMNTGNVRIPDVSFIPLSSFPKGVLPEETVWDVTPTLIVEVLSESNTEREIAIKLKELFSRGCQLAWVVDRHSRTVSEYKDPSARRVLPSNGWLNGGTILPGFRMRISSLFTNTLNKK